MRCIDLDTRTYMREAPSCFLEPAKKKAVFFTASKYPGLDSYSGDRQGEWGIARAVHQREQQAFGRCSNASSRQGWPLWPIINYGATPTQNPHPGPNPPWGFWDGRRRVVERAMHVTCFAASVFPREVRQNNCKCTHWRTEPGHTPATRLVFNCVWPAALAGGIWPPVERSD